MTHTVTVTHTFEAAHRLPHIPGKCESLHGHSWQVAVTVSADELDPSGMVVEFGEFKAELRAWIDSRLDHGVMLGPDDPLVPILRDERTKVWQTPSWPTVETVATMLADVAGDLLEHIPHVHGAQVSAVDVRETGTNCAGWRP